MCVYHFVVFEYYILIFWQNKVMMMIFRFCAFHSTFCRKLHAQHKTMQHGSPWCSVYTNYIHSFPCKLRPMVDANLRSLCPAVTSDWCTQNRRSLKVSAAKFQQQYTSQHKDEMQKVERKVCMEITLPQWLRVPRSANHMVQQSSRPAESWRSWRRHTNDFDPISVISSRLIRLAAIQHCPLLLPTGKTTDMLQYAAH